jgi:hypothetical protein
VAVVSAVRGPDGQTISTILVVVITGGRTRRVPGVRLASTDQLIPAWTPNLRPPLAAAAMPVSAAEAATRVATGSIVLMPTTTPGRGSQPDAPRRPAAPAVDNHHATLKSRAAPRTTT